MVLHAFPLPLTSTNWPWHLALFFAVLSLGLVICLFLLFSSSLSTFVSFVPLLILCLLPYPTSFFVPYPILCAMLCPTHSLFFPFLVHQLLTVLFTSLPLVLFLSLLSVVTWASVSFVDVIKCAYKVRKALLTVSLPANRALQSDITSSLILIAVALCSKILPQNSFLTGARESQVRRKPYTSGKS